MNEIFKDIPMGTPEEILDSVYAEKKSECKELDMVLNKMMPFSPVLYLNDQLNTDVLTDVLYGKGLNGKVVYPFASKHADNIKPYEGRIGDQTSRFHKENIAQHLESVVARLSDAEIKDFSADEVALMALLHDAGKKYTYGTNFRGEVCFYGHEALSAYIAACIYKSLGFSRLEAEPFVIAIHSHMLPFNVWNRTPDKKGFDGLYLDGKEEKKKFIEKYGLSVTNLVEKLNQCDRGYTSYESIKKGEEVINKGYDIIAIDLSWYCRQKQKGKA